VVRFASGVVVAVKVTLAVAFQEILSFLFLCHRYFGATTGTVCGSSSVRLESRFLGRKFLDLVFLLLLFLFISVWTCGSPHANGGN